MKQLLLYTKSRLATDKWVVFAQVLMVVLVLPALYAIGVADQPELFSYVEEGLFYGTYQYDFTRASSMTGLVVVVWVWLGSVRALSRYHDRRSGIFYALLPVRWGAKFAYHALVALVVAPLLLWAFRSANHAVWFYFLVEEPMMTTSGWVSELPFGFLTLLLWFNALFFMIGAVVRKYALVWCVAIFGLLVGLFYMEQTYWNEWAVVRTFLDFNRFTTLHLVAMWSSMVLFIVIAARATRRLEVR